jgi:hypothetical protein
VAAKRSCIGKRTANDRRMRGLITQVRQVAAKAGELNIGRAATT